MAGRGRGRRGAGGLTCAARLRTDRLVLEPLADAPPGASRSSSTRTPRCCATCPSRGAHRRARRGPGTPIGWSAAARSTAWACGWGSSTTRGPRDSSAFVGLYMLTPPHGPSQPKVPRPGRPRLPDPPRPLAAGRSPRRAPSSCCGTPSRPSAWTGCIAQTMAVNAGSRATMASVGLTFVRVVHRAVRRAGARLGAGRGRVRDHPRRVVGEAQVGPQRRWVSNPTVSRAAVAQQPRRPGAVAISHLGRDQHAGPAVAQRPPPPARTGCPAAAARARWLSNLRQVDIGCRATAAPPARCSPHRCPAGRGRWLSNLAAESHGLPSHRCPAGRLLTHRSAPGTVARPDRCRRGSGAGPPRRGGRPRPPRSTPPARPAGRTARGR